METTLTQFALTGPLYLFVLAGYLIARAFRLKPQVQTAFTKFVFSFVMPILLFRLLSRFGGFEPAQFGALAAFFGGAIVVFVVGSIFAARVLKLGGVERSVFGIGGVFSNNVMLGVPLSQILLGPAAIPTVAAVLVFNVATLWTIVTVSIEWSRQGRSNVRDLVRTLVSVLVNPIVVSIALGAAWAAFGWSLPDFVAVPMDFVGAVAGPSALLAMGMGLATYTFGTTWSVAAALTAFKLVVHPLAVWGLAVAFGLGELETRVVVLLASLALGSNVFLMAKRFEALERPVSQATLASSFVSSFTTPLFLGILSL